MTKLRKFFASSVMIMTVVVMSGFVAPTTKAAASAGDLIKKDGLSAVYYLGDDGKRYVFPNEATYKSWYSDFSGVVTISSDELSSYPLGGNVVVRPGTFLVKITTDPKVYAVEANGTLRWVQTEADAIALYGTNWAKRVIDVADSFFINYTIGTPLASNEVPFGSLLQKSGESNIYYYNGSEYRLVEDEVAFLANRFQFSNVLTYNNFTPSGSTLTGAEANIIKTSQEVSGNYNPGQGTGLSVSLNSATPIAQSVPSTVGRIPFTKVNLTASNDGAAYVESITFKRTGLTTVSTYFKVWAEKDGASITSKKTLSSNDDVTLNFSPTLVIPAGQTVALDILGDVSAVTGNGALAIESASAVSASGSSVSGSFPITGNLMSFTDYKVTEVKFDAGDSTYSPKVGDEDVEIGRFDIELSANDRDVVLDTLTLKNTGTEDLTDSLMNVYLENKGEIVSENATINGRYLTFTFKNGGLDLLKDDDELSFIIKGDVIGKDSSAGTLIFSLNKTEELYAYEKSTGFGVSYSSSADYGFGTVTISAGSVNISKKSTSPAAQNVIKGTKSVVALIANVRADEAITTDEFNVHFYGDYDSFQNVRVYLNNQVLESFDLPSTSTYSVEGIQNIDSSLTLNKGDNEVRILVDVKSAAVTTKKFKAVLQSDFLGSAPEYVSNGLSVASIGGTATGAEVAVVGGGMTLTRNDGFADNRIVVQGSTDVLLGKFAVQATDDAIKLTSVTLSSNSGAATSTLDSSVYDMKIKVDGTQIGDTKDFSTGATFSSLNYNIAANTTKIIELYGSFDSAAADDRDDTTTGSNNFTRFKTTMTVYANDSLGKVVTEKSAVTTQFKVTEGGTLTVAKDADSAGTNVLIANSAEQEVAKFKFTAIDDSANITEFKVSNAVYNSSSNETDARISSLKLYLGSTLLSEAVPVNNSATFYITNNNLLVNANASQVVTVKAVFTGIDASGNSGRTLQLQVVDDSIKAKASGGSELATSAISGDNTAAANTMTIRKTKPTFAKVSGVVAGASTEQEMVRFSISADANEDLNVTQLVFDKIGASVASVTAFKLYEIGDSSFIKSETGQTGATATLGLMDIRVAKGTSKTFKLVADTSALNEDADTFGITLNAGTSGANITWGEYFVAGYSTGLPGTSISELPINGGLDTNY